VGCQQVGLEQADWILSKLIMELLALSQRWWTFDGLLINAALKQDQPDRQVYAI